MIMIYIIIVDLAVEFPSASPTKSYEVTEVAGLFLLVGVVAPTFEEPPGTPHTDTYSIYLANYCTYLLDLSLIYVI